jgi:Na+-transporting NADH:ubiquinone oxidoreductase subunit C
MQKGDARVLTFAAAVCVTCSLLLSGAAALLRDRQDYNVELDRKTNVLKAFGVDVVDDHGKRTVTGAEVERYFVDHIREVVVDPESGQVLEGVTSADLTKEERKQKTKLPLYIWTEEGQTTKYAFPISGYGLWSTIYGYMALDRDLVTIIGVTFYDHGETPGLGGEVSAAWFQEQFAGKKVRQEQFEVVKGGVETKYPNGCDHCVDGIAAATITGNGVQAFLNKDLQRYEAYFQSIRGS